MLRRIYYTLLLLGIGLSVAALLTVGAPKKCSFVQPDGQCVSLEVVTDPVAHAKGLSGRSSLADNAGMLFVFGQSGVHCFWMKDMRFSIDMVWLNEQLNVVYVVQDARPESYPASYCPPTTARYVIEVQAGKSAAMGLVLGRTLIGLDGLEQKRMID